MSDTVEVIILAKDEASRTIGGVRQALGGLGGVVGGVARVGTAAFLGVGAAAVGGFGLALKSSIGMNAQLEQSTMMFTTLMGDSQLAEDHVRSLFDFAAQTPFETGPIIEASKHLQIFGGDALNTMGNLALVGDAAAAVGAPIDEVAFWVGRMYSNLQAGQPFGEAAMRLQELGIMAPGTRQAMEDLQKTGADGATVWNEFTGAAGNFTGAMVMQSQSWTGLTSTIRDNISMIMADTLRPFFELLKTGLSGLATWLASPEVQTGITNLATKFGELASKITEFVTTAVIPFVQEHGPALKQVAIGLAVAFGALLVIGAVGAAIAVLTNPITWVVLAIGALAAAWTTNWGGIQEKTAVVVEYIKGIIQGGLDFIQNLWAIHGGTIMGIVQTVMSTIQAVIGAALAGIQAFWDQHGAAIMAVVSAAWGFIQTFIQVAVALIVGTAQTGLETVRAFWQSHGEAIMKVAQVAWEFISRIIEGVLEHVKLVFDAWRALLQGDFETFKTKMVEIWQNLWDTVVDVLRGLWERFSPLFQELWSRISGWFSSMDWASLGRSVIMGIVNGLRNAAGALWSAIQDIIQQARNAAGAAAGEGSPARLFIPLGEAIGQGIIVGIQNTAGDMMTTLEGLMKNISSVAGLGGAFANLFEARNIAPVEARLKSLSDELAGFMPDLEGELASMGKLWNDPGLREFLQGKIASSAFGSDEWASATRALAMYDRRLELMRQQAALQGQLEAGQNRLLLLETQRQQIGFLQQQFELLKLIRENGLGADILEGLTLGLEADPGALMNAMIAALQQMIAAAENELGIASPSKWAQRTMQNVIGSMADTLNRGSTLVRDGLSLTPARIAAVDGGRAGGGSAGMVVNIDARRAERGVDRDLKAMVEEVMRTYGTRADIRMRTS